MPALALTVAAIALPDSLNPSLIVADIYLAVGRGGFRRSFVFTIAALAVTLAGGLVVALGLGDLILSLLPKLSKAAKWRVGTAVGALLMCAAAVIWWRREALADSEPPSGRERTAGGHGGSAALAGAGIAALELLTAFPYFAAIAIIVGSSVSGGGKLFLLGLYNLIYVLPLIAIVIVCGVTGERGARVLTPAADWIAMHWPIVVAPLVATVGLAVGVYSILQLT